MIEGHDPRSCLLITIINVLIWIIIGVIAVKVWERL